MADDYKRREAAIEAMEELPDYDSAAKGIAAIHEIPAADVVDGALFRDCRNELCLRCGQYRLRYKGACDGCRWMEVQDGG